MDPTLATDVNPVVSGDHVEPAETNTVHVEQTATPAEPEMSSGHSNREGWREMGMSWFASKTPKLREGLLKSKASIEKGVASVTNYTNTETKLLMSQAKRKIYCSGGKIEDPEFAVILNQVGTWKASLEAQRRCIRRVVNTQRLLEESQRSLCRALLQVPDNSECCKKSAELAAVVESRVQMLVPSDNLRELENQIEKLLSLDYTEILMTTKRYETAKNEADVCMAKMESSGATESMNSQLVRATDEYMRCKDRIVVLWNKLIETQDNTLCPILLKATGLEGLEDINTVSLEADADLRQTDEEVPQLE